MRGGFRKVINGGSPVSEVDIDGTRLARREVAEQVRLRNHLVRLLAETPVDEDLVRVTPLRVVDGVDEPESEVKSAS